jgi:hypothetical protein
MLTDPATIPVTMCGFGNLALWLMLLASSHGPVLTVHLKVAPELAGTPCRLRVFRLGDMNTENVKPIRDLDIQESSTTIRGLLPDNYQLDASINWHHTFAEIEIVPRGRSEVTLAIERVLLRGRVVKDDAPIPAMLKFIEPGPQSVDELASTSGDGLYEAHIWPLAGYSVTARSTDPAQPGWTTESFVSTDEPEQTKDFKLHHVLVRVTLVDSITSLPIRDGRLIFMSGAGVNVPPADDSGRVDITTLRPGQAELTGQAPGYQTRRFHFEVAETDDPQDETLALTPKGPGRSFRALLPSGSPASNVSARYVEGHDEIGGLLIPCDAAGNCVAPDSASDFAMAIFFGPDFGLTVRPLSDVVDAGTVVLDPSGGILDVYVPARAAGSTPVQVAVVVNGLDVEGHLLLLVDEASGGEGLFNYTAFEVGARRLTVRGLPTGRVMVRLISVPADRSADPYPPIVAGPIEVTLPSPPVTLSVR